MKIQTLISSLLIIILSICVQYLYAQDIKVDNQIGGLNIEIAFDDVPFSRSGKGDIIDYILEIDESKPGAPKLPTKTFFIAIPPDSKVRVQNFTRSRTTISSVVPQSNPIVSFSTDSNLVYTPTKIDPKYYRYNIYPSNDIEISGYFWIRDYYCVALQFNTHRYDWSKRQILVMDSAQFDLEFYDLEPFIVNNSPASKFDSNLKNIIANYDQAAQFRSFQTKSEQTARYENWIDFNADYLKLGVASDGIYRITKNDLQNYSINVTSINPKSFRLILKGNEIPIFVNGENDGSFDDNDFIEFYGSMNYADGNHRIVNQLDEPYNEYIDRYSDTTVYWLTWGGNEGVRIDSSSYGFSGITDTLDYYTQILHYEVNQFLDYSTRNLVEWQNPEWIYNESWIWGNQGVGTRNLNFVVDHLVSNNTVKGFYRIRSYASDISGEENAHNFALSINNDPTMYDSGYINKYEQKILVAEFPSNLLSNGTNRLKAHSFQVPNSEINLVQRDWYEIEYPRYLYLINDSLKFKFNQPNLNSLQIISFSGAVANNHIVYKIRDRRRITNFLRINDNLFFADTVKSGDELYICTEDQILTPVFYYKKSFEDLTSSDIQADYILISHPSFETEVNEYLDFVNNNYEVSTKFINVVDIYDQFNYGFFSPEPIKDFLYRAYQSWGNPKPSYVFLVGEANYDYHNYKEMEDFSPNYVPSFGHPVSDNWFVMWDSSTVPQMYIGRLPVKSSEELLHYLDKHSNYISESYNSWNKSFFLLSGGANESEKIIGKETNDEIRTNTLVPRPIGGYVSQLYATENPLTNFGPFLQEYIDSVFDHGGVIVSYIGHSGTKIWDNGIENVSQLKNIYNKSALINDFGCSTGKFAEPDITCFAEAFTNGLEGDAIAYLGNSSLGFTSTSYRYPGIFFGQIRNGQTLNISANHISGKAELIYNYGNSPSIKLFVLCNTLLGDPIVSLRIPQKPNLNINTSDIVIPQFLDDNLDSIIVKINFRNLGWADSGKFNVKLEDYLNSEIVYSKSIRMDLPLNNQQIESYIPTKDRAGQHNLIITLDSDNELDEISKNDNIVSILFNVQTSSVRAIVADSSKVINSGNIKLLNSIRKPAVDTVLVKLSLQPDFIESQSYQVEFDTLATLVNFENLSDSKRYWYRTSLTSSPDDIFETKSFLFNSNNTFNFAFADSISATDFSFDGTTYNGEYIFLGEREIPLLISSAGFEPGGIAKIELDNTDYTNNAFGCGHHIVVIDEATMQFEDYRWFNFWNDPNNYEAYVNYLNTIGPGKLVAISLGADCAGASISNELKDKLHEFGSAYIDSVDWATSWILLGKLGASIGSVPEDFSRTGVVSFDTTFTRTNQVGYFTTSIINNSAIWDSLYVSANSVNTNEQLIIKPIVHDEVADTLAPLMLSGSASDLSMLNNYPGKDVSLLFELSADNEGISPEVNSIKIKYNLIPELGTNYQVVKSTADTVYIGEDIGLSFYVYNVGESVANSFIVNVQVINEDNSRNTIFSHLVDNLEPDNRKFFEITYNTSSTTGSKTFLISIDYEEKVKELFEDNNFYTVPFYIKPDTSQPSLQISFDGGDILDGDYISPNPEIRIELSDETLIPITDSSAITIFLNDEPVYYANNQNTLSIQFYQQNPKAVVTYTPQLADGEYTLTAFGKNSLGTVVDSNGVSKQFTVSNEIKLLNVYNYPNPTSGETYFTFKLTRIPDQIRIKIFTVAGRLIKELKIPASGLNYDFNKIYWDGKDEDGDVIGNGVYLYKVILIAGDKTEDVIQKLAIVR